MGGSVRRHLTAVGACMVLAGLAAVFAHDVLRGQVPLGLPEQSAIERATAPQSAIERATAPRSAIERATAPQSPIERATSALLAHARGLGLMPDMTEAAALVESFEGEDLISTFLERRFVFVARGPSSPHRDVFLLRVRLAPNGAVLATGTIYNLTRTVDADEAWLSVHPAEVAFVTRYEGVSTGLTVLDLNGAGAAESTASAGLARAVTHFLEVGDVRGVGVTRLLLRRPSVDLRLHFEGAALRVAQLDDDGWHEALLELGPGGQGVVGPIPAFLRAVETHRSDRSLLSWAVDTARSLDFIGPDRIYALEEVFFRLADGWQTLSYRLLGPGPERAALPESAAVSPPGEVSPQAHDIPPTGPEFSPKDLVVQLDPALPDEGRWRPYDFRPRSPSAPPVFWRTTLRVDEERPDAKTELVLIDMRQVELRMVGGTEHPRSTTGEVGTGSVPSEDRGRTLAAFNGGFQAVHGAFGMVVDRNVLLPPLPDVATVLTYKDGFTAFGTWPADRALPVGLRSLRQNLPPLVTDGVPPPPGRRTWGFTLKGSDPIFTWRSGLARTSEGRLLYAVCRRCSGESLALAMRLGGADYAMHLDMNVSNIGFEFWRDDGREGRGSRGISREALLPEMWHSSEPRYVDPHPRDFFYLVQKAGPAPRALDEDLARFSDPLAPGSLPRNSETWPPSFTLGRLRPSNSTDPLVVFSIEPSLSRVSTTKDRKGTCRLSIHRGVAGEGLASSVHGDVPLRADRGTLLIDGQGHPALSADGRTGTEVGFFQQLPMLTGPHAAPAIDGPRRRWALCGDADGRLYLIGGGQRGAELLRGALALRLGVCVDPAPLDGEPVLECPTGAGGGGAGGGRASVWGGRAPQRHHDLFLSPTDVWPHPPVGRLDGANASAWDRP